MLYRIFTHPLQQEAELYGSFSHDDGDGFAGVDNEYDDDADNDGDVDRAWQFAIQDTGIACGDVRAQLNGETLAGEMFWGNDTFTTVDCDDGGCHP